MKKHKNLKELTRLTSNSIFDSITILESIRELIDGERKLDTLLGIALGKMKTAFYTIDKCRRIISDLD